MTDPLVVHETSDPEPETIETADITSDSDDETAGDMASERTPQIEDVLELFETSRSGAPRGASFRPRPFYPGQSVNDAGDGDGGSTALVVPDDPTAGGPLALGGQVRDSMTIDASMFKAGTTIEGVVLGTRAVAYEQTERVRRIHLFKPGLAYIGNANAMERLHEIGCALGNPDHYVVVRDGVPIREKGISHTHQQRADRIRNYVERMVQFYATNRIRDGIVVLDGALSQDTFDTPPKLIERLAEAITSRGNHLIALSKKTRITVNGRELRYALDAYPEGPYYRYLNPVLREERIAAAKTDGPRRRRDPIGHLYAVRFAFTGETYRLDVVPAPGFGPDEALASFYASTRFRAGYPEVLIRAHLHAFYPYPDLIALQAAAVTEFGFDLRRELNHTPAFAPFGGRWK